ncbi:acylneuraminate cytidylyltransferase family protein [Paraclostridium bifermentans]|uniref:acylneuraminate cytidylyltransferase family protein n=1 Tax=Paraclostridium bifermentans TaxID=1490 RepID=UPI0022E22842|nr:acylneuraminate cytidylyltransferase family protein [Paraclostridium bifermentans]
MFDNKKFLAIIPARSGSKGLKDKNIKQLKNKPLIAYTIEAAKKSNIFDNIIVSTDSTVYADISKEYGAEIPFLRPKQISEDATTTVDVIVHTLKELKKRGKTYDYFVLLQPTSPLRNFEDIRGAVSMLIEKQANSIISVCEVDHSSELNICLGESYSMDGFLNNKNLRRQDMPTEYRVNGAIYICHVKYFEKHKNFYDNNSYAYIMDKKNSIDIDDIYDFKVAEAMLD